MELGSWMDKCPKANEEHVLLLSFFLLLYVYDVGPIFNPNLDPIAKQKTRFQVFISQSITQLISISLTRSPSKHHLTG
jgi:hypothetical protein